jgi:thiamine-phosphate pyrophosphorylase
VAAVRTRWPNVLLGVSCYNELERALAAERAGADYVAFGRFFASATKPGDIRASLELVAQAKRVLRVPIVGIGGITLRNAPALVAGGVDALAVVSALFGAADIRAAAERFATLYGAPGA